MRNNFLLAQAIEKILVYTNNRFEKRPRIKTNMETGHGYLDKAKFLTKWSCFDGYMQYVDSYVKDPCIGLDRDEFQVLLKKAAAADPTIDADFYNSYLTEELIVQNISCGGYLNQPLCLYDFTVKTLQHDCLNFSTRHISENGEAGFILLNYIGQLGRSTE